MPENSPAAAGPSTSTGMPRIRRIDFWRGVAIVAIFINHGPPTPFNRLTWSQYGFSNAAMLFFFLSGFVAYLAYRKVWRHSGQLGVTAKAARRSASLYGWNAVISLVLLLIWTLYANLYPHFEGLYAFNEAFFDDPLGSIVGLFTLQYAPERFLILRYYVVLMLIVPFLLPLAYSKYAKYLLAVTAALAAAPHTNIAPMLHLDALPVELWYHPFSILFLFTLGMYLARLKNEGYSFRPGKQTAMALGAFLLIALPFNLAQTKPGLAAALQSIPPLQGVAEVLLTPIPLLDSQTFHLLNILHFLALIALVNYFVRRDDFLDRSRVAHWLELGGRHALEFYCLSNVLLYIARAPYSVHYTANPLIQALLWTPVLAVLLLLPVAIDRTKKAIAGAKLPALRPSIPDTPVPADEELTQRMG